jgi:hypothetical protein
LCEHTRKLTRGENMYQSDAEQWEDYLAAEVIRMINDVPVVERGRLLPGFVYVRELMSEHAPRADEVTPEGARTYVERRLPRRLFRDLLDQQRPTSSQVVRRIAEAEGRRQVIAKKALFDRYCYGVLDPNESPGYAFLGLWELGRRMTPSDPPKDEVREPFAYFATVLRGLIAKDIDAEMKHADPWTYRRYELMRRLTKLIEQADPNGSDEAHEEEAARRAEELLAQLQTLRRGDFDEALTIGSDPDFTDLVHSDIVIESIERRISRPPFTPTDRLTWRLWRAADFRGADIDWAAEALKGSAGPQRLLSLLRKLREVLDELEFLNP